MHRFSSLRSNLHEIFWFCLEFDRVPPFSISVGLDASVVAVVAGEYGDHLVVDRLPEGKMLGEIKKYRSSVVVAIDKKLEVSGVLAGGGLPEVLVKVEVEQNGSFLALGVGEELDAGEVDTDFFSVVTSACGLAKIVFGQHFTVLE